MVVLIGDFVGHTALMAAELDSLSRSMSVTPVASKARPAARSTANSKPSAIQQIAHHTAQPQPLPEQPEQQRTADADTRQTTKRLHLALETGCGFGTA